MNYNVFGIWFYWGFHVGFGSTNLNSKVMVRARIWGISAGPLGLIWARPLRAKPDLSNSFGKWPGDESDEEILKVLEEIK